jgi:hypothetical protein
MNHEQEIVYTIKGVIASLSPVEQEVCNELVEHMRRQIEAAGEPVGTLALALVGAEAQLKASQ